MLVLFSLLFLFACQHGPQCDSRVIEWDASWYATSYTLYWKSNSAIQNPDFWQATVDICPATCIMPGAILNPEDPCWPDFRESCVVHIRHPSSGNIIYFSLTASNAAGESGH